MSTLIDCNEDRPDSASLLVLSFEANLRQVKVGQISDTLSNNNKHF